MKKKIKKGGNIKNNVKRLHGYNSTAYKVSKLFEKTERFKKET